MKFGIGCIVSPDETLTAFNMNHLMPASLATSSSCAIERDAYARHATLHLLAAMLLGGLLALLMMSPAFAADVCYVVADNVSSSGVDAESFDDGLVQVNIFTGAETMVGRTGTSGIEAIDFHPTTGILYAADGGRLGTIHLSSGDFSPVGQIGFGSASGASGSTLIDNIDGLAFDPTTGRLYGSERLGGADVLVTIDHHTGRVVKDAFGAGKDFVVIDPVGGLDDIDDLAFDSRGRLYGTANEDGRGDHLVRIDKQTGETDDLGRIRNAGGSALDNFEALTATPAGKLIGVQGGQSRDVYEIDPSNARATKLSSLSVSSDYESISCVQTEPDVRLEKKVDRPAPEKGEEVTFTIYLESRSSDLFDVVVVDKLPKELKLRNTNASSGDVDVSSDGRTVTWTIDHLSLGESENLEITLKVDTKHHVENCARIHDSTPSLGSSVKSCVSVTPTHSSGGGDAGVESNGTLATQMAGRLFARRQDVQMKEALLAAPKPKIFNERTEAAGIVSKSGSIGLASLIPQIGPEGSQAFAVTPDDLLAVTNAQSVLAVDYLRPEGRRMAALFAAISPSGVLYDHAKTTCDRLAGGTLDDVSLIDIDGKPFVLSRLIHADGATDHAVSFVIYHTGGQIVVDSRFAADQYDIPETAEDVINLQVWSVAPEYTAQLVAHILERLNLEGDVTYLNTSESAPPVPTFYVKSGRYERGALTLEIASGAEPTTVVVRGSTAVSESEAERGARTPFERTITVPPAAGDDDAVDVVVQLGLVFDAIIEVVEEGSKGMDQLYYADGAWGHTFGSESAVTSFATRAHQTAIVDDRSYVVERSASMNGFVTDWASMFKFLRPGGQPVDLSGHELLEFTAMGRGMVQVVLEKASIPSWDQFSYLISLSPNGRSYQIPYGRFTRSGGAGGFTAEDVTLVAFYVIGNRQFATDFDLTVGNVRFVSASSVAADDEAALPHSVRLAQNYPNPFNPETRIAFDLPASAPVRLAVYDVLGREVAVLIDEIRSAGRHEAVFEAGSLTSGTYVYRLHTPATTLSGTMILLQ